MNFRETSGQTTAMASRPTRSGRVGQGAPARLIRQSGRRMLRASLMLFMLALPGTAAAEEKVPEGDFEVSLGETGITSLRRKGDLHDTDYISAEKALGAEVIARYREVSETDWRESGGNFEAIAVAENRFRLATPDGAELGITQEFRVDPERLDWSITLENRSAKSLEVGDLAVPMVLAESIPRDRREIYTRKLVRHSFIAGHGSWIYWTRANAVGPYLVMTTGPDTRFEYFDNSARVFTPYVHGSVTSREAIARAAAFGGKADPWRLPLTTVTLSPAGTSGAAVTYRFRFRFAADLDGIRDLLYEEDLIDVSVLPGMTLPVDLPATLSLRTKLDLAGVEAEFPDRTRIEYLGEKGRDNHLYRVRFGKLGENLLRVRNGRDRWTSLEFYVTEPLETVIAKRATFLAERQQHDDPSKPWYGAYGDWDQVHKVLRNPEDRDGMRPWLVDSSDDAGNARPAFLAAKNVFLPVPSEIESVERYIRHYLWNDLRDGKGGMQMTESEKYPYGIYGTFDNWWGHRASDDPGRDGRAHLWRIYDYPHIIHLYFRMYQLASYYPDLVKWRDAEQYLELAYRTAKAYWEVPLEIEGWSADSVGTMGEAFLPELIGAFEEEGKQEWADDIRRRWEGKVARFVRDTPNLYGSEFSFDSTGFESTQAFARYARRHAPKGEEETPLPEGFDGMSRAEIEAFAKLQMALNVCVRGWLETTYYQLGSDYRSSMSYLLSYMSHLGGWAVLDHALYFAEEPAALLRLGYASSLSSWALVNSGTEESGYGFWYPGAENDGAAGGGFVPEAWGRGWIGKEMPRGAWYYSAEQDVGFVGALRAHCTVLTDDPRFGELVLGGDFERQDDMVKIIPKDGLGARFHMLRGEERMHLLLERDRFARGRPIVVSDALERIEFAVESRGGPDHRGTGSIAGLPAGEYVYRIDGEPAGRLVGGVGERSLEFPVASGRVTTIQLERTR